MNADLKEALIRCETDVDEALYRLSEDENLYVRCLEEFLCDQTVAELGDSLQAQRWDDAFTAAHALKGLAGNLGFVPLFHATAELVVLIRGGRVSELDASFQELKRCYNAVLMAIKQNCNVSVQNNRRVNG